MATAEDEALIERLQKAAFGYLTRHGNRENGLVADTSRPNSPCSIAVVGFALSCYPVALKRGWISRAEAVARTLAALRFLQSSPQGEEPDATGYKGLFYHFLDMQSGRRVWTCELSLIDTALLIAGVLVARTFFDGQGEEEEIVALADEICGRIDWCWALDGGTTLSQGWKPEIGFLQSAWEGYNEATILYVLGAGTGQTRLNAENFDGWTLTYQWERMLGADVLYSGPLFTHLFSHAWIDFRGIRDAFMRERDSDYFENTRAAIAIHREYGRRNPLGFAGYGSDFWGVTAGDGPGNRDLRLADHDRRFFGYMSRGVPFGPDDGTIAPWAMPACLPFDAEAALAGTRNLLRNYPQVLRRDRFVSGFNPTVPNRRRGWVSKGLYGLDQGLLVLSIENARSGFVWDLMRGCTPMAAGLREMGFAGGWLDP